MQRADGINVSVWGGDRDRAVFHAVCDVLEEELGAESAVFPAAHDHQLVGEPFNERLRAFWEST